MIDGQTIEHSAEPCLAGTKPKAVRVFGNGRPAPSRPTVLAPISKPVPDRLGLVAYCRSASRRLLSLTKRQKQILDLIVDGAPSKNIAVDLGISQRTVEAHRHEIASRTGARNLSALVRLANCGSCILGSSNDRRLEGLGPSIPAWTAHDVVTTGICEKTAVLTADEGRSIHVDMQELQHRMKNMMGVIQSLARQSMRDSGTKDEFFEQFFGRLTSYSKSVDMLVANRWHGLEIHELVWCQLEAFGIRDCMQIVVDGPELRLSTVGAHNLGLAVHELATNALKYGALSVPLGKVNIGWSVITDEGKDCLRVVWRETNGPRTVQPTRVGFGRRIVEELVPSALSGRSAHEFHTDGVRWELIVPTSPALG